MPPEETPTITPTPTPAPAPAAPAPAPAAPAADPDWLPERLARAQRQVLKEAGFASPEEAKAAKEQLVKIEKERKDAETAQLSEVERLKRANEETDAKLKAAEAKSAELERKAKVDEILRKKGITNMDYAHFILDKKRGDATDFDYDKAITDSLGEPATKIALGFADASAATVVPTTPASTTPNTSPETTPKPPTATPTPAKTAREMNDAEWAAYKRKHGI